MSTTTIPLSSLCVAAAIVCGAADGKIIDCNDLFRQLIAIDHNVHQDQEQRETERGGSKATEENDRDIGTSSTTMSKSLLLELKDIPIWESLGIPVPDDDLLLSNEADTITKQIFQGPNVPSLWVRIHIAPLVLDATTTAQHFLVQIEDIDNATRAKNQFTGILETSFDGFWDYHIPKDYEYMSPRFWEMFGYDPSEKQHKPSEWMDMVHPDDFKASMSDLQQHFTSRGKVPYIRETRYKHKDGSWVWVLCRGKVIEWDETTGAPLRMIGTHTDITQSKLKALRERDLYSKIEQEQKRIVAAKEELRKFIDTANAPVFGTDANGVIDCWNHRMEEITGIQASTVLGIALDQTPISEATHIVQQALEGIESTNQLLKVPFSHDNDDDDRQKQNSSATTSPSPTLKLLINTTTRRNLSDGGILGCVCFGLDLTEIQSAQSKLLRVEERFKAEKQLNEFVAHEVRNPLAAAISASGFIKDTVGGRDLLQLLPSDIQESLDEDIVTVVDSLEYIHQLLTSMLDLNKFLEQGASLVPRPALLKRDIVDPVFSLYKRRANKLIVTTEVWLRNPKDGLLHNIMSKSDNNNSRDKNDGSNSNSGSDQRISVDVVRLKQILINLISNSIKFTKEGFVRVQVGRFDADKPSNLTISVEDSGPGIPKDKHELLFKKYVQLSTQVQGSGIGLALTRQLVSAMNGTIDVDEQYQSGIPGMPGTRFVVHIHAPTVNASDSAPASSTTRSTSPTSNANSQTDQISQLIHLNENGNRTESNRNGNLQTMTTSFSSKQADTNRIQEEEHGSNAVNQSRQTYGRDRDSFSESETYSVEEVIDICNLSRRGTYENVDNNNDVSGGGGTGPGANGNCRQSEFRTTNLRVLIVDDDRIIRKLLTRRLQNIDKTMIIETAESGEIAIQKITGANLEKYDLVLMDHFMPLCGGKLTGEETIKVIRPFVDGIIAGSSGNDMSREHAAAGADLFWLKPVPKGNVLLDDLREAFKVNSCTSAKNGCKKKKWDNTIKE